MKKNSNGKQSYPWGRAGKGWLFLQLFVFFLFGGIVQGHAAGSMQRETVILKNSEAKVGEVLDLIESQLKYDIFYSDDKLDLGRMVKLPSLKMDVKQLLDHLLDSRFSYEFIDRIIVISPMKQESLKELLVQGVVKDVEGMPLPGVTVLVKGSTVGVATDKDGRFQLRMKEMKGLTLVFSFVGKESKEVPYKGQKELVVTLHDVSSEMEEVVAVGYGTTKVKDMTGAVSRLGEKDIAKAPMGASIQSLLQGKAPGVNVMIGSASPTAPVSVVIRGASSLSGDSQPLWVIDGVPEYNAGTSGDITNTLYNLNITDVESIDILKDASATAIYGSRAANGVVIVTTKRGKSGMKPQLEFSARYGIQVMDANDFDVLNADEYKKYVKSSLAMGLYSTGHFGFFHGMYLDKLYFYNNVLTSQLDLDFLTDEFYRKDAFGTGDTKWFDLMTHNAATQDYSIGLRGGTKASSYSASIYYKDQKGIVKGGRSKMLGASFNFDAAVRDVIRFKMNLKANARNTENKDYMIESILSMRPDVEPYNPDGSINMINFYVKNPLLSLQDKHGGKGRDFSGTLGLEWDIIKGLTFRTRGTMRYNVNKNQGYIKGWYEDAESEASLNNNENYTYVWDNTLTYMNTWKKHNLVGMAGFSMEKHEREGFFARAKSFPDDDVLTNLGSAAKMDMMDNTHSANSLVSFFSRIEYKYNNRYLLTLNFRTDGSSKFGPDKRWGYFPSAALAWILTEEKFMQGCSDIVSYMKLRASIGRTGSQNLGNYTWRTLLTSQKYDGQPGVIPETLGNDVLQWEEQVQKEVGLDYGFWNDRIRGSLGFYVKDVDNLLYADPVAISSSFTRVIQNIGALKNTGVEFDVQMDIIKNQEKDLTWNVDFNISKNRTTLERLNSTDEYFGGANDLFRIPVGGQTGKFYGFKDAGRLFMTQEEAIALRGVNPKNGRLQVYRNPYEGAGDLYVLDLNGNGKIDFNGDDYTEIGNSNPDFIGGFGTTLYWKGLMANATFNYSVGADRLWQQERDQADDMNQNNATNRVLGSWTVNPGVNTEYPRTMFQGLARNNLMTDRYIHDASYLRLAALNLSYRLPKRLYKNSIMNSLEFTFQATNLFTITDYPGLDPQGNFSTNYSTMRNMGVDYSTYPAARTYNFGIKLTLK